MLIHELTYSLGLIAFFFIYYFVTEISLIEQEDTPIYDFIYCFMVMALNFDLCSHITVYNHCPARLHFIFFSVVGSGLNTTPLGADC